MKKHFNKIVIISLLTIGFVLPAAVLAAGKPTLCKKSLELTVGNTAKLTIKNVDKKAKVTWKTTKKSVVKIVKKKSSGKKIYARIKGIRAGKATIKAFYKSGKKKKTFKCLVTVTDVNGTDSGVNVPAGSTAGPIASPVTPTKGPDDPNQATPTKGPDDPNPATPTAEPGNPTPAPDATATPAPTPGSDGNLIDHEANGKEAEISFEDIINNGNP